MKQIYTLGLKKFTLLCATLLLVVIVWGSLAPASASLQLESRIRALEVDISGIELQLNQIEAQLNQPRRSVSPQAPSAPAPLNRGRKSQSQLNRDPMFDRLATLVVELKQQINNLETRVARLESRGVPRTPR
ncbi:MAG TPA: hypothetical protein V6D03_09505 [Candidatus Caenarcaniphilales bacterium]